MGGNMGKQIKNAQTSIFCLVILMSTMGLAFVPTAPAMLLTQTQVVSTNDGLVVALTQEQAKQCEAERQALQQQLNQCGSDAKCRAAVQAAIDSHNQRCR